MTPILAIADKLDEELARTSNSTFSTHHLFHCANCLSGEASVVGGSTPTRFEPEIIA